MGCPADRRIRKGGRGTDAGLGADSDPRDGPQSAWRPSTASPAGSAVTRSGSVQPASSLPSSSRRRTRHRPPGASSVGVALPQHTRVSRSTWLRSGRPFPSLPTAGVTRHARSALLCGQVTDAANAQAGRSTVPHPRLTPHPCLRRLTLSHRPLCPSCARVRCRLRVHSSRGDPTRQGPPAHAPGTPLPAGPHHRQGDLVTGPCAPRARVYDAGSGCIPAGATPPVRDPQPMPPAPRCQPARTIGRGDLVCRPCAPRARARVRRYGERASWVRSSRGKAPRDRPPLIVGASAALVLSLALCARPDCGRRQRRWCDVGEY